MGKALQCQATMRLPGRKTANGKRKEKESERRKQISEAFLRERLGLEDDWIERWSEGDELREESLAPGELPRFIRARIEQDAKTDKDVNIPQEMRDVKKAVESLVAAGCRRRVVYFCLEELSPEAGAIRAGRRRRSILTQDGEYDLLPGREPPPRRPTREHMKALSNQAKAFRRQIHRYRSELLLVADTGEVPLPPGSKDADDALALLKDSLTWVSGLADAYAAPFERTLVKSKGLLYLTAYVGLVAEANKIRGRARAELYSALADLVAKLAIGTPEQHWAPSDLRDKLQNFRQRYPRLHKTLVKKLGELHGFHANG